MKSFLFGLMLVLTGSSFANVAYNCDVKVDGYITTKMEGIELVYGQPGVTLTLNDHTVLEFDFKSSGRSNKMPTHRLAWAVVAHGDKIIQRNAYEFETLPNKLVLQKDSGDLDIRLECEQK